MTNTRPRPTVQILEPAKVNALQDAFNKVLAVCPSTTGLLVDYEKRFQVIGDKVGPYMVVSGKLYSDDCPVTHTNSNKTRHVKSNFRQLVTMNPDPAKVKDVNDVILKGILYPLLRNFVSANSLRRLGPMNTLSLDKLNYSVICRSRISSTHAVNWHLDAQDQGIGKPVYQIIYYVDTPKNANTGNNVTGIKNAGTLSYILTHGTPDPGNSRASRNSMPAMAGYLIPTKGAGIGFEPYSSWHKVSPSNISISRSIIAINIYDPNQPYDRTMVFGGAVINNNMSRRMNAYVNSVQKIYDNIPTTKERIEFINSITNKPRIY